jgi:Coenzyme F420-reducing hydrogenase, beta subunit
LLQGIKPDIAYQITSDAATTYLIHVSDESLRKNCSSGGFITGLFLFLLERKKIDGCIVARCEGKTPLIAETIIAGSREDILSACGSKYAPVSNCTILKDLKNRPGRYAIIGTPCMLESAVKLEKQLPWLRQKIALKVGFVCAGMASRLSTKRYIEKHGHINAADARKICYRGNGWPGRFRVFGENNVLLMDKPYLGGSLQNVVAKDHYLRCNNCLDHWSHFADIVVSDPWCEEMIKSEKLGWSAVMIRNRTGMDAVQTAIESNYFVARSITVQEMVGYNKDLVISDNHSRHCWMIAYQLLIMRRIGFVVPLIKKLLMGQRFGIIATIRAFATRRYYF